jgi:predicted dehydrogenase
MSLYSAAIVGLTGIGAARPANDKGPGLYAAMPRSHAAAYYRHPQTQLRAVCDQNPTALEQFRQTWQDVWPEMRYFSDSQQMLDEIEPDLFSVVTSDHAHADLVVAAAQGSPKAILCEKPIATTLADADHMIAACEKTNTLLSIEHTRRWDPVFIKARELIRSGELGPLRTIVVEMFGLRAMLFRNGIHLIDLMNYYAETPVQWLVAELEEGFAGSDQYAGSGGRDPNSEPYVSAYIRYGADVRAFFNSYKTTLPGWQMNITCDDGRLELSDRNARLIRGASHYEWSASDLYIGHYMHSHQLGAVAELVDVLEHGGDLVCPASAARSALEIALAMLRSHNAGNKRIDLPLS